MLPLGLAVQVELEVLETPTVELVALARWQPVEAGAAGAGPVARMVPELMEGPQQTPITLAAAGVAALMAAARAEILAASTAMGGTAETGKPEVAAGLEVLTLPSLNPVTGVLAPREPALEVGQVVGVQAEARGRVEMALLVTYSPMGTALAAGAAGQVEHKMALLAAGAVGVVMAGAVGVAARPRLVGVLVDQALQALLSSLTHPWRDRKAQERQPGQAL